MVRMLSLSNALKAMASCRVHMVGGVRQCCPHHSWRHLVPEALHSLDATALLTLLSFITPACCIWLSFSTSLPCQLANPGCCTMPLPSSPGVSLFLLKPVSVGQCLWCAPECQIRQASPHPPPQGIESHLWASPCTHGKPQPVRAAACLAAMLQMTRRLTLPDRISSFIL